MRLPRRKPKPKNEPAAPPPPLPEAQPAASQCGRCGADLAHTGAVCDCRKA